MSTETKLFLKRKHALRCCSEESISRVNWFVIFLSYCEAKCHFTDIRSKKRECELRVNQGNRGFSVKGMKEGLSLRSVCETVLSVCQRERCWTHHDAGSSCRVPKTDQVQKNHFILFLHYIGFLCVICGCFVGVVVWGMLFFEHC